MNVLAVFAHPDDEILAAGGTLAKLASQGHHVTVTIAASTGVWHTGTEKLENRELLLPHMACKCLGISQVRTWGYPDQTLDQVPERDLGDLFIRDVRSVQPQLVITHHLADLNVDHQRIARAAMVATRPGVLRDHTPEVWASWVPSSSDSAFGYVGDFRPNLFVDILLTKHLKDQALTVYESEMRPYPHPRSVEGIAVHERFWGTIGGFLCAEPFQVLRRSF